MPRPRMSLAVVATVLLWSACQDGRPIVTITTGTAGGGGGGVAGNTGAAGASGGTGGSGFACDGGPVVFCTDGSMVCSLAACPGTAGTGGSTGSAGTGGSSGAAGTGSAGAGQVGIGTIIACPPSPPSGSCSVNFMSCAYPILNESCHCTGGSWSCAPCPASAQATTSGGLCTYGNLTCSTWGCGVCPATRPTGGAACGNTMFKCNYGDDVCLCGGNLDGWLCGSLSCPEHPTNADNRRINCATFTLMNGNGASFDHACHYAVENQSCSCNDGSGFGTYVCSCPAAAPAEGGACVGVGPCSYGGLTCNCSNGHWNCGGACPASKPAVGSSCSAQLSCSYANDGGTDYCACNGSTWSCQ